VTVIHAQLGDIALCKRSGDAVGDGDVAHESKWRLHTLIEPAEAFRDGWLEQEGWAFLEYDDRIQAGNSQIGCESCWWMPVNRLKYTYYYWMSQVRWSEDFGQVHCNRRKKCLLPWASGPKTRPPITHTQICISPIIDSMVGKHFFGHHSSINIGFRRLGEETEDKDRVKHSSRLENRTYLL